MLKRRQYVALFENRVKTDPYTGRQKQVPVYIGPMYAFAADDNRRRRTALWLLALCTASVGLYICYGFINSAGSRCFYVLPLYLLSAFPLFYLCYGAVRLYRLKPSFTKVDKDESADRIRTSALGLGIICAAHTVCEIVFMLVGGAGGLLARELCCTAALLLTGACALIALRLMNDLPIDDISQSKGTAAHTAD